MDEVFKGSASYNLAYGDVNWRCVRQGSPQKKDVTKNTDTRNQSKPFQPNRQTDEAPVTKCYSREGLYGSSRVALLPTAKSLLDICPNPPIHPSPTLVLPEETVTTPPTHYHSQSELHGQIGTPLQVPLFVKLMNCWLKRSLLNVKKFLIIKLTRSTNFSNLFLEYDSTCFGQYLCPSSGVWHCTHSNSYGSNRLC